MQTITLAKWAKKNNISLEYASNLVQMKLIQLNEDGLIDELSANNILSTITDKDGENVDYLYLRGGYIECDILEALVMQKFKELLLDIVSNTSPDLPMKDEPDSDTLTALY